jgi:hypothetical protein
MITTSIFYTDYSISYNKEKVKHNALSKIAPPIQAGQHILHIYFVIFISYAASYTHHLLQAASYNNHHRFY